MKNERTVITDITYDNIDALMEQALLDGTPIDASNFPLLKVRGHALKPVALFGAAYGNKPIFKDVSLGDGAVSQPSQSDYYQLYYAIPDGGDVAIEITRSPEQGTHASEGQGHWVSAWDAERGKGVPLGHLQPQQGKPLIDQLGEYVSSQHVFNAHFMQTHKPAHPLLPAPSAANGGIVGR